MSKISRMETGIRGLYRDDVSAVLGYLQAPSKLREELMELVHDGASRNWIRVGSGLPRMWRDLIRIENEAAAIYNYEPLLIPGLLQTGDYARAVLTAANADYAEGAVDHLVRTRMGRQSLLSRFNGPTLRVIIDEMVLRRQVGEPGVMHGQLQHLLNMMNKPQVELRVVPFAVGAYAGLDGPLMLLEFIDQPTLVCAETRGTSCFLEEPPEINGVKLAWRGIRSKAMSPEDSARLIAEIAGELPTHQEHHDDPPGPDPSRVAQEQLQQQSSQLR